MPTLSSSLLTGGPTRWRLTGVVVGCTVLTVLACTGAETLSRPADRSAPPPGATVTAAAPVQPPSAVAAIEDERNSIDVFRTMAPATVYVTQNQLVRDRYSMRQTEVPAGAGSGFVWDDKGHIVTNYHVIDNAQSLTVTLFDQSMWPATLVGGDPRKDVAVLKIDAPTSVLKAVVLPPPGYEPQVGQKTLAIGNPFGLDHTLTTGVVSALGREILGYGEVTIKGMIQTDASINPGNSGGPLLDSSGRLIGMNTMIFSQAGQSAGIGFAVPFTVIERVVTQVVATGRVSQVGIGVTLLPDHIARRAGINGVVIQEVRAGTPAAAAGIRGLTSGSRGPVLGDIITSIDGKAVKNYDELYNALDVRRPGETISLGLVRDGKPMSLELPLVDVNGAE
jgi:S1-C subfamily serine protease